jgi:hypothetical protein
VWCVVEEYSKFIKRKMVQSIWCQCIKGPINIGTFDQAQNTAVEHIEDVTGHFFWIPSAHRLALENAEIREPLEKILAPGCPHSKKRSLLSLALTSSHLTRCTASLRLNRQDITHRHRPRVKHASRRPDVRSLVPEIRSSKCANNPGSERAGVKLGVVPAKALLNGQ